ncbi:NAD-dependent epimerase/dehydratase family protein [Enterococcus thailandicus]|uniref:NAD-dependent epimerase/dehydratase family protein n=1 Tax=Enterococcus thailandicus TaxID=417368 RepID=UPI00244D91FF|nr:NAD-dependent epimerase/dehydratase family protein [Enterococcus thailandicus]GMC00035.1 oxidoreductase [Enterococcus thailandicus]
MKVLVTGANGFVATHIIKLLQEKNYEVNGTVRNLDRAPVIFEGVSYFAADLTSASGWKNSMVGVDAILHVASPLGHENSNDPKLIDEAVQGVQHVFDAAHQAGIKRIIMTSSQAAATPLASTTGVIDETYWSDQHNPELNAYRLSKLAAEKKAWELAKKYDLALTTILPGAIFGKALTSNRSSNGVLDGIKRSRLVPKITLEVTDVNDLANLHLLALENNDTIGERILAKNTDLSFAQISRIYGNQPIIVPDFALKFAAKFVGELRSLVPMLKRKYTHSNQKAIKLGWQPRDGRQTVLEAIEN